MAGLSDGKIQNVCEVHCAGCEHPFLGLRWPKKLAEKEPRDHGWNLKWKRWYCPACPTPQPWRAT